MYGEESFMATSDQPITRSESREDLKHYATKADIADVRADMAQMETRLVKWMIGIMFGADALSTSIALVIQGLVG